MRLRSSLRASAGRPIAMVCGSLALSFGVACGGGSAAQPTPPPAQVAPTAAPVASPQRPQLTSPVPSPVGTTASAPASATSTTSAASPGTAASSGSEQTYEVQSGDTLLSIADQFYGDVTRWRGIYDANKDVIGDNPDALKIGMKLKIPPKDS